MTTSPREKRIVWTIIYIADWEGGATVHATEVGMRRRVRLDAKEAAEYSGEKLPLLKDVGIPGLVEFIIDNGWKVQHYLIESHEVAL